MFRWLQRFLLVLFVLLTTPVIAEAGVDPPATPSPAAPQGLVAQVSFVDQTDLQRLVARYDVWHVDHQAQRATVWLTSAELPRLQAQGRRLVIDQRATDDFYAAQAAVKTATSDGGIPGYACYRTVEETYASMVQLSAAFPDLVSEVTLGESWERACSAGTDGYEIRGVVLTNQATPGPKPAFFLIGAIHAREYTTAETAMRFAEHLVRGYGVDADSTWLLDYTEIHVVPLANPDGRKKAETGLLWRKNTNNDFCAFDFNSFGVDLNRNSSFKWAQCSDFGCSSSYACDITYRGSTAASEPETQALEGYMRAIFPDVRGALDSDAAPVDTPGLMISLHSYYPKILFPWGWTPSPAPNGMELQTLARKFGYYTGYPACQSGAPGCIYLTDGTTDDFAYGELGVAAFTFELGNAFFETCIAFESSIITPTLASLTYAAKSAVKPYIAPSGPEVISATLSSTGLVKAGDVVTLTVIADDTRFYSGGYGDEPVQPIQAVRYSVNEPGWIWCATHQSMTALDGNFDSEVEASVGVVNTHDLMPGRHLLMIEAQDTTGIWGPPTGIFLDVVDSEGNLPEDPYTPRVELCSAAYLPIIGR